MHDEFHVENEFRFRSSSEVKIPRGELSFLIEITATDESKEHRAHVRIKNSSLANDRNDDDDEEDDSSTSAPPPTRTSHPFLLLAVVAEPEPK